MDRWLIALIAGIVGGAAGSLAVGLVSKAEPSAPSHSAAEESLLREVRDRLAALEARGSGPSLAGATPAASGGSGAAAAADPTFAAGGAVGVRPVGREEIEAIAARAAELAIEKQEGRKKEEAKANERKKLTLAEAARELELTTSQEEELRRIYADATDKALKMMAEPESDAETLRRELDAAKDDPAKKSAITMRLLPKFFTKLGDVMAIETEKNARVVKTLGKEKAAKFERFQIAEEDPWGIGDSIMVGATVDGE
jgi:hypothetical protein